MSANGGDWPMEAGPFGLWVSLARVGAHYLVRPEYYLGWLGGLAILGLPTALVALPVFRAARRHGLARGVNLAFAPVVTIFAAAWLYSLSPAKLSASDGMALGFVMMIVSGFALLIWLPIAGAMAAIGAVVRRRRSMDGLQHR